MEINVINLEKRVIIRSLAAMRYPNNQIGLIMPHI